MGRYSQELSVRWSFGLLHSRGCYFQAGVIIQCPRYVKKGTGPRGNFREGDVPFSRYGTCQVAQKALTFGIQAATTRVSSLVGARSLLIALKGIIYIPTSNCWTSTQPLHSLNLTWKLVTKLAKFFDGACPNNFVQ